MFETVRLKMGQRPSVLIIEAQQSTRTLLEMTLFCEGMRVFSAVSISSALLQLRVLQPDLIVVGLDHQTQHWPGVTAQIRGLSLAPLLVLGDRDEAIAQLGGVIDTLPYPIEAKQLCAKVAYLLGGHTLPAA